MTKKEELKEKIKQAEQLVDNLKSELEILEKEPEFKRVNLGESFYMIDTRFGTIAKTLWYKIQEQAKEQLKDCTNVSKSVVKHWQSIVNGQVPFGYIVVDDE